MFIKVTNNFKHIKQGGKIMNITELTVHELQEKLRNKELTVKEITKAYEEYEDWDDAEDDDISK